MKQGTYRKVRVDHEYKDLFKYECVFCNVDVTEWSDYGSDRSCPLSDHACEGYLLFDDLEDRVTYLESLVAYQGELLSERDS